MFKIINRLPVCFQAFIINYNRFKCIKSIKSYNTTKKSKLVHQIDQSISSLIEQQQQHAPFDFIILQSCDQLSFVRHSVVSVVHSFWSLISKSVENVEKKFKCDKSESNIELCYRSTLNNQYYFFDNTIHKMFHFRLCTRQTDSYTNADNHCCVT